MRFRLISDWSKLGVAGVGGNVSLELFPGGDAGEGVDGNDDMKRLSDGETGTLVRRM